MGEAYSDDFWQKPPCYKQPVVITVLPPDHPYKACRLSRDHDGDCDIRPTKEEWYRWLLYEEEIKP